MGLTGWEKENSVFKGTDIVKFIDFVSRLERSGRVG